MKQDKLIDALNDVDQEYIDEAAPRIRAQGRLRPWLALAACLVLAVGIFAAVRLIPQPEKPGSVSQGPSPYEPAYEEPGDDKDESCWPEPNTDTQTILDYRLGDLYLGMPRQEVLDLYGKPTDQSKGGPVILEDGSARDTWWYKRSGDPAHMCDFQLQFADKGSGWVVNEISVYNDFALDLPHGIRIGMTNEELLSVWPELETTSDVWRDDGPSDSESTVHPIIRYSQYCRHLQFEIRLEANRVEAVRLGTFYEDPMDAPGSGLPYSFSSGDITVWRQTDSGWDSVQKADRGAKMLETIFTIEELVSLEQAPGEIRYVVDFQNDTVCLVCAPEEGITSGPNTPPDAWGAVYHLEDRDAFEASLAAGDAVPQGLRCLEQCVFPYGTWNTLGEVFE